MCFGPFAAKTPDIAKPPQRSDPSVVAAAEAERRRAALAGRAQTILTGPQGDLSPAPTAQKVLLGA